MSEREVRAHVTPPDIPRGPGVRYHVRVCQRSAECTSVSQVSVNVPSEGRQTHQFLPHLSKVYLMANNGFCPVKFISTTETAFYFEVAGEDVEEDAFAEAARAISQRLFRTNDNKVLILNDDKQFQAQNLTIEQQCKPDCEFSIKFYNNSLGNSNGRAVMLYVNKGGKKMVACCNEKHEIYPEEMDLPKQIGESGHKAVFYWTTLPSSGNLLESSVYPAEFLGFEPDVDDCTLIKLVLHPKGHDEVDESCQIFFSQCIE